MKKLVLKADIKNDTAKRKAMKIIALCPGVNSVSLEPDSRKLTVVGDVDPVAIVNKLRKHCFTEIISVEAAEKEKGKHCAAEIITVESAEKEKEKLKKEEATKEEPKKEEATKEEAKKKEWKACKREVARYEKAYQAFNP